jgi:mono/diheme cytochrome c family protein
MVENSVTNPGDARVEPNLGANATSIPALRRLRGWPLALFALLLAGGIALFAQVESPVTAGAAAIQDCSTFDVPNCGGQGSAGAGVYASICSTCHGERMEGLDGPALAGARSVVLDYRTAGGLYDYVATYMPDDAPGSLSERQYLDVVAFLLHANRVHPGGDLDRGSLGDIGLR